MVSAAREALAAGRAELVLPYVPADREEEVRDAFDAVIGVRGQGSAIREIADLHFFETVVRVHRAGEGAPYTGLKPAGLDHGPVIPVAERAIESDSPDALIELLTGQVREEIRRRFANLMELKARANGDIEVNRAYVEAMLDLQVWAHDLYEATKAPAHEHQHHHE